MRIFGGTSRAYSRIDGSGLSGSDVIDRCKCGGPVFTQSPNAAKLKTKKVDGSPRYFHKRCPQRREGGR